MSDEISIPMSLPLDGDGFLRRECPTCERQFKCLVSQDNADATPAPPGGYFCPYCAVQAPADSWWTKAQLEAGKAVLHRKVIAPELEKFRRNIDQINRGSGLLNISARIEGDEPEELSLGETDDMRRIVFGCHPDDPIKVLDDWERPVHCLICAELAT